jgi:hypothetical protein
MSLMISDGRDELDAGGGISKMKILGIMALCAALGGCASSSNVSPLGANNFMVSRQAATGFSGAGSLKEEALAEAAQFCSARHQQFLATDVIEAQPPYVMGNFPRATVKFSCT